MADNPYVSDTTCWYIRGVRDAIAKIHSQGEIGTVNLERCVKYLDEAEANLVRNGENTAQLRERLRSFLGIED